MPDAVKTLHVITGLATGGAETMLWKLLAGSAELRRGSSVFSLMDRGTIGSRIESLGVPLTCAGMRRGIPGPLSALRAARALRRGQHDLVQGWMYHGNLAAVALARPRMPVLWNIRQSFSGFEVETTLTRCVIQACARASARPARIVYNSRTSAEQHEAIGFAADRRVVIPNGFDTTVFRPDAAARGQLRQQLGLAEDVVLLGLVARWHPMKNHVGFLGAAERLTAKFPSLHVALAGAGVTPERLGSHMQSTSLRGRVHLLGEVAESQRVIAGLDVLCSASGWGEGFPNVVGEAMSAGVPCVVTDVGDSATLVGDTGVAVPPAQPEALVSALERMLALPADTRQGLGANARMRIEHEFSISSVAQRYADLYRAVAQETSSARVESRPA